MQREESWIALTLNGHSAVIFPQRRRGAKFAKEDEVESKQLSTCDRLIFAKPLLTLRDVMRTVDPTLPRNGTDFIATGALVFVVVELRKHGDSN